LLTISGPPLSSFRSIPSPPSLKNTISISHDAGADYEFSKCLFIWKCLMSVFLLKNTFTSYIIVD
jgi:hypothetical protein